ncbi:MAG: aldehyde ferredoxin oxidoreductase N-terminal domain-containing protein [Thermodesulfobacteriota bacterium]
MNQPRGFSGNVLYVDLGSGATETRPLAPELCERFIGGLGLCVKLAYDNITPGVEPLAPEAAIVLGAGPLVGTNLPSSSRVYAVARLPQSRSIGWCGAGGMVFGCMLKNAGLDHIVIRGKAGRPSYLYIEDGKTEIRDAAGIWGLGMDEAAEALWEREGRPAGVLTIGQAAENLVPFSLAFIDRAATLGRGGFGAVLGSKNLKAIVVKGSRGVRVHDRKAYRKLANTLAESIKNYEYLKEWQELGLVKSLPVLSRQDYATIRQRRIACVSCPIGDKDVVRIPDGPHAGFTACSSSVANLCLPTIYGIADFRDAIMLSAEVDCLGLDIYELFGLLIFARDLVQNGLLKLAPGEPPINTADWESTAAWARAIALRKGTGALIANGYRALILACGPGAEALAPYTVKNMLTYVGPKGPLPWNLFGTMELGQAMDPRGPHVGASGSPTYFAKRPLAVFPKHLRRMGVPEDALQRILPGLSDPDGTPKSLRIGRLLKYSQTWFTVLGSLGLCARAQINRFYSCDLAAALYQAVTGIPTTRDQLVFRAQRAWTLLRLANIREGFTAEQDAPPARWFKDPPFKDYLTEQPLTPEAVQTLMADYYDEQGWDPKTGVPTAERLHELGIDEER